MLKYKDYQLIKPDSSQKKQITEIIRKCNGSIFHDVTLNEIVSNHFRTELYYLVDNPNFISSLAPVHVEKRKFGMNTFHFCPEIDIPYAGFVGEDEVNVNDFSRSFFDTITYKGFPYKREIKNKSVKVKIGETSMIDLSLEEEHILNKIIHSRRRNMIRKAIKNGVKIKFFNDTQGLNEFWPILERLHIKLGYNITYGYYKEIITTLGATNEAFILIAYIDDVAISGMLIIGNQNYMHFYKGASLVNTGNNGHSELLHWEAIKTSKFFGSKHYDLCNLNKDELPEIYRFKTSISNDIYQYPIYYYSPFHIKAINKITRYFQ